MFWGWQRRHTHGGGGLRGYEGQMCMAVDDFVSKWIYGNRFWLAQFSLVLLLRLLPWIELKRSRLREGIGRVGKNNWELRLYIFILFFILT